MIVESLKRPSRAAPVFAVAVAMGCAAHRPVPVDHALPFLVKLNEIRVERLEDQKAEAETPALFDAPAELTRDFAAALDATGLFTWVAAAPDLSIAADLELTIEIVNPDFGPGEPALGGAVISTLAWLVIGQFSWFIENRAYPSSEVTLRVGLRPPATTTLAREKWFSDDLSVRGLELNFLERADMGNWLSNIFLPPWYGDGDPQVAGKSLAGRTMDFFASREPERISFAFPTMYFNNVRAFLLVDEANEAIVIVSDGRLDQVVVISAMSSRSWRGEKLSERALERQEERDSVRPLLAAQAVGLETTGNHFYRFPLPSHEIGLVRVRAKFPNETTPRGRWTLFRDDPSLSP